MVNLTRPVQEYDPEERPVYRSFVNHVNDEADEKYEEDFDAELKNPKNHQMLPNSCLGLEDDFMEKVHSCKEKFMRKANAGSDIEF